ncbi:hypothetical protein DET59_12922 [Rossellomorea aquimaris]|uniref:Uncharacterized protein n=1 Tax=Rossellomorea aquimaris TaxID=189382 RepID=A0A366EE27_9BACI|nr:hypothetical protein DET59_12922 [Rossellomorea aquimaris]
MPKISLVDTGSVIIRVFGKEYADEDVYIKIRAELLNLTHVAGDSFILVMSFHFAEIPFKEEGFPYRKKR